MSSHPISLSDESLTNLTQMLRPLEPAARVAFMTALAEELKCLEQPVGDGVVHRCASTLLRTGMFKREGAFVRDDHYGPSEGKLRRRHAG